MDNIYRLFDDEDLHEMSEGHTFEYCSTDEDDAFYRMYDCEEVLDISEDEEMDGVVYKYKNEYNMTCTVSTFYNYSEIYNDALEHINKIKAARDFLEKDPNYDENMYINRSEIQDNHGFYEALSKCSEDVKSVYASMFLGVTGICEQAVLDVLGVDMEVDDRSTAYFIKIDGEYSDTLIASLISKSCANYLPRVCRPTLLNTRCVSEGDVVQYTKQIPEVLEKNLNCEFYLSINTDKFNNVLDDINRIRESKEGYQGIDDKVWGIAEYPIIEEDTFMKTDIRRDFYNNIDVDVEVYDKTPANEMFEKIYELVYTYYDGVFNHDDDSEFNRIEICKQALKEILQEYNN